MSDWPWNRRRRQRHIDLTAMVDVIFQLIVFLVLMASFEDAPAIDLKLPEASTAAVVDKTISRITVALDGRMFWNSDEVDDLVSLKERINKYAGENRTEIQIMADKGVDYGKVIDVIDACRSFGLNNLILGMEEPQS